MARSDQVLKLILDRFEAQSRRLDHQDVLLREILTEAHHTSERIGTLEHGQQDIQRRADEREEAARARARRTFDWRIAGLSCACLLASGAIGELLHLIL